MNTQHSRQEEGTTLLEILIATTVFVVVLGLSLALATSFASFGSDADADASAQFDAHRSFTRVESLLRQGWSTPELSASGEALEIDLLGYSYNGTTDQWDRIAPETWRREYDLSLGEYHFEDSFGTPLSVVQCSVEWQRLSSDPTSEDYHFGDVVSTISDSLGNSTSSTLATRIGTYQLNEAGTERLPGLFFEIQGLSILVNLNLQREIDHVPYSVRSRVKRRNFIEDSQ
jgi:Tfp pilus assembly protein PilV